MDEIPSYTNRKQILKEQLLKGERVKRNTTLTT
jgi:hypothetical protein